MRGEAIGHPLESQVIGMNAVDEAIQPAGTKQVDAFDQQQMAVAFRDPPVDDFAHVPAHSV